MGFTDIYALIINSTGQFQYSLSWDDSIFIYIYV